MAKRRFTTLCTKCGTEYTDKTRRGHAAFFGHGPFLVDIESGRSVAEILTEKRAADEKANSRVCEMNSRDLQPGDPVKIRAVAAEIHGKVFIAGTFVRNERDWCLVKLTPEGQEVAYPAKDVERFP